MAAFDSRCAALYLFLITVADAQGLGYYGDATLAALLHFSPEGLALARARLIELDLLAYQPPLYQVLAIASDQPTKGDEERRAMPDAGVSDYTLKFAHLLIAIPTCTTCDKARFFETSQKVVESLRARAR